ncbi:MAG: Maf family protein [Clostridiales Family XIII bacterium]|jgi:septum formation protein|nr:Maf family protein [Clostridiales Family XIII bacterium]
MAYHIILASGSPRRYEILKAHGVEPVVIPPDVDESLPAGMDESDPEAVVCYLSRVKAYAVLSRITSGEFAAHPESLPDVLLASDTLVYNEEIIGKPVDEDDAFRILASYRNKTHEVWSGVTLLARSTGAEDTFAVRTRLTLGDYGDDEIRDYVRREKPYDKSGAYAIQSSFGKNVTAREGDFENVIGLPWPAVREHLMRLTSCAIPDTGPKYAANSPQG